MNAPIKEKAQGGNPGLLQKKDQRPQASIKCNTTHVSLRCLYSVEKGIRYAQFHLSEYSLQTDQPDNGIVETADALDLALHELAKAKGLV